MRHLLVIRQLLNIMKKNKVQDQFLEKLAKIPIIQVAAEKTGVSRNSIYRWRKEDPVFAEKMDNALAAGVALVNDMTESQLLTMIKEKSWSAISFWLRHRNDNYKNKIEVTTKNETEELTPEQEKIVREALKLSTFITNNKKTNEQQTNAPTTIDKHDDKRQES